MIGIAVTQFRTCYAVITSYSQAPPSPAISVTSNHKGFFLGSHSTSITNWFQHFILRPSLKEQPISGKRDGVTCKGMSSFICDVSAAHILTFPLLVLLLRG